MFSTRGRPSPGSVEDVTVRIVGGDGAVVAERVGHPADGLVEWADVTVPSPGLYRVEIDVRRPALPVSPVLASWQVHPTPVPRVPTVVSTDSWAPIAAGLFVFRVLLVAAGWWATGRNRRSVPGPRCRPSSAIGHSAQSRPVGFSIPGGRGTMQHVEDTLQADPRMGNYTYQGTDHN